MVLKVTVKTLDSKDYHFEAGIDWTVRRFKQHIESSISVPTKEQRLIYCGRVLLDDKKLIEYDCDGKVIHLVKSAPPFQFRRHRFSEIPRFTPNSPFGVPSLLSEQRSITIEFNEATHWCSIAYYEYGKRLSERFQPRSHTCFIDGLTESTCSDRLCIGKYKSTEKNPETEWIKSLIGEGFKLSYTDGDVYLECLSNSPIFVATSLIKDQSNDAGADGLLKIQPGAKSKIFTNTMFEDLLVKAVPQGFEAVYKLTDYCNIHLSFVKGWGGNYKRQTISQVPCWLEVQFNAPLQWIDQALRQLRPPLQGGDSTS